MLIKMQSNKILLLNITKTNSKLLIVFDKKINTRLLPGGSTIQNLHKSWLVLLKIENIV